MMTVRLPKDLKEKLEHSGIPSSGFVCNFEPVVPIQPDSATFPGFPGIYRSWSVSGERWNSGCCRSAVTKSAVRLPLVVVGRVRTPLGLPSSRPLSFHPTEEGINWQVSVILYNLSKRISNYVMHGFLNRATRARQKLQR